MIECVCADCMKIKDTPPETDLGEGYRRCTSPAPRDDLRLSEISSILEKKKKKKSKRKKKETKFIS